jgi:hypothetical protein
MQKHLVIKEAENKSLEEMDVGSNAAVRLTTQ